MTIHSEIEKNPGKLEPHGGNGGQDLPGFTINCLSYLENQHLDLFTNDSILVLNSLH